MAQQTAVMAIAKAFRNWQREWDRYDKEGTNKPPSFDDFVKPFLQMEKEQMLNVFQESRLTHPMIGFKHQTFLEYYNETYGE